MESVDDPVDASGVRAQGEEDHAKVVGLDPPDRREVDVHRVHFPRQRERKFESCPAGKEKGAVDLAPLG